MQSNSCILLLACRCEQNVVSLLQCDRILRDLHGQWRRHPIAVLPVLLLGQEGDFQGLWDIVSRVVPSSAPVQTQYPNVEEARLLEQALEEISMSIVHTICQRNTHPPLTPTFRYGIQEGYWCIFASIPRNTPIDRPRQTTLF